MTASEKVSSEIELEEKWGKEALSLGWTAVPTSLFFLQQALNLTPVEFNVIINLISHWWKKTDKVYPSQSAIAHRMGVSKRTVQRAIDSLETRGLIEVSGTSRVGKFRGRNIYDLKPLRNTLNNLSPQLRDRVSSAKQWKEIMEND